MKYKLLLLFFCLFVIEYSFAHTYISLSEARKTYGNYGMLREPNSNIRTNQIYIGLSVEVCYPDDMKRILVSGFASSLKVPPKYENDKIFVPTFNTVKQTNPAYKAGLRIGDEILEYNDIVVTNDNHLYLLISRTLIGTSPKIKYRRNGKIHLTVVHPEIRKFGINLNTHRFLYKVECDDILARYSY